MALGNPPPLPLFYLIFCTTKLYQPQFLQLIKINYILLETLHANHIINCF